MSNNSFGRLFKITTWGESHGKAIGVVIDGCPSGISISEEEIHEELKKRSPGQPLTSPRKEKDFPEILSGVYKGITTGAPISILIRNENYDSSAYLNLENIYRPGHANFTYLHKFGHFDPRGGGRASARETAGRVAAGAIAKKMISAAEICICSSLCEVGGEVDPNLFNRRIEEAREKGDSIGGVIFTEISGLPVGLGDPVYGRLDGILAQAMLSIPASKGFEIGEGFASAKMEGSMHNDGFKNEKGNVIPSSNHAGGLLGGITTGAPLFFKVAFKPTSSIRIAQETTTLSGKHAIMNLTENSRHDPCIAIRARPVVEAMGALVIADALLMNRMSRLATESITYSPYAKKS